MVIVRESPRAKLSPSKSTSQWPPASPFEALVSSPGGRKKWLDMQDARRERSASPSARTRSTNTHEFQDDTLDEESLRLELQILEAKKKLVDLAKRKREQEQVSETDSRARSRSPLKRRRLVQEVQAPVQVPVSPSKLDKPVALPQSPVRARLGLGPSRAANVSLKRATDSTSNVPAVQNAKPVSSFSQRLAGARSSVLDKQQKSERLDSIRSSTFAQVTAKQTASQPAMKSSRSLQDLIATASAPTTSAALTRTASISSSGTARSRGRKTNSTKDEQYYDPFSELHLSERKISHTDVAKRLVGCEVYTIPELFKEVKGPAYDPPDCESDYVVFAVLASKTSPFEQRETAKIHDKNKEDDGTRIAKNKFMVLRLCDLKWELDCYLFGTGFEQFWKLTEGSLVAILNPAIMPPKANQYNGRFSLKIASSEDQILEIGTARDLGYCEEIKKDGKKCDAWVNKAKSRFCEFHVNLHLAKTRKGRMEVNDMWRGKSPEPQAKRNTIVKNHYEYGQYWTTGNTGRVSAAKLMDQDDTDALHKMTRDEASRKRIAAAQRERDLLGQLGSMRGGVAGDYFRAKHGIATTQDEIPGQPMFVKPSAAELGLLSKKAEEQRLSPAKDRRRHFGIGAVTSAGSEAMGWSGARKYGLLEPKKSRIGSPERGQTTLAVTSQRGVLQSPARDRSLSPRKQARFKLDKGIRQPGRESGGPELTAANERNSDESNDDDDLDIV